MKPKEIVTLVVALIVIVVAGYFGYTLLFPNNSGQQNQNVQAEKVPVIPAEIDENKVYPSVESLSDYGKPALDGLGKSDLFK